ncbi:uracil-DNA glycosylase [Deltaproteobacteria bacterium]|nr:uracil-DNA glycosylase [Deltaproteobacteria bacterium]
MNTTAEFREIIGQLKKLMISNMGMGLNFPAFSQSSGKNLSETRSQAGSIEDLKDLIGDCRRCKLWHGRTSLVFGEGAPRARLVFVGEGPGREEDLEGRPFVGEAGKLLTKIIEKGMGIKREEVYICNVVKCRPPNNRDPERDEIETCIPFLKEQIRIIGPEVICVLGRIAGRGLFGRDFKITRERGSWDSFMDIPVMPTYHPAYLLRNPKRERQLKGEVWQDIQEIMARLGLEVKK